MKEAVAAIINDVRLKGDEALLRYNMQFDKNPGKPFEMTKEGIKQCYSQISEDLMNAIKTAILNVTAVSNAQIARLNGFTLQMPYGKVGQRVLPIDSVGCYVPGGRYPLISSAVMSVVPAKVAGVKEIIVSSPNINPSVVVAADLAGASRIFNIGGVQAIAALAYGTESVPKVVKIVGPGNKYVTEAKRQVFGDVGIDFIAGPSEIMVIADKSSDEDLINADIEAQKEHDPDALAYVMMVESEDDIQRAIDAANSVAPEHLELMLAEPEKYIPLLRNYGSLFIGRNSGVVFGDYCSGTNHILPTSGAARYAGGLSVTDFVKYLSFQQIDKPQLLKKTAITLAEAEGLVLHKKSAEMRSQG